MTIMTNKMAIMWARTWSTQSTDATDDDDDAQIAPKTRRWGDT